MTVYFIGAGPGAPDLITVRGLKLIERCPVCLYAGSLVPEEIVKAAPEEALVKDTAPMHLDEIIEEMKAAHVRGQDVARVHSGDPAIYGAVAEQMRGSMRWRSTTRWCRVCRPLPERRRSSRPN
jgi:precorrin-4/cobalt-precorrin-4 C11-methyltransferase